MLRRFPASLLVAIGVILFAMFQVLAGCGVRSKEDVMLEYQRTGGIAGLDDRLVIRADGKAILTRKDEQSEFELTSRQISTLKQQLAISSGTAIASFVARAISSLRFCFSSSFPFGRE